MHLDDVTTCEVVCDVFIIGLLYIVLCAGQH